MQLELLHFLCHKRSLGMRLVCCSKCEDLQQHNEELTAELKEETAKAEGLSSLVEKLQKDLDIEMSYSKER